MKADFINKLLAQPWNTSRMHGRQTIASLITLLRSDRPAEDCFGDPLPKMQILGDVAIVPIRGNLLINVPQWLKEYGASLTDANDIAEELARAVADPTVALIVLDIDSTGGWAIAGDKLFEIVETANRKKPVFAFTADGAFCCSSAYEAAAPCVAIYSGRHSLGIGCVGSYSAWLDDSAYWEALGVKLEIFQSGAFKGIGETALTDEQRAFLQSLVDESGARFRANVMKYRTGIAAEDMQGQWFSSSESVKRGFIAGTVSDLSAAVAKCRKLAGV